MPDEKESVTQDESKPQVKANNQEQLIDQYQQLRQKQVDETLKILHEQVDKLQVRPGILKQFLFIIADADGYDESLSNMSPAEKIGIANALMAKNTQRLNLR